MGQLALRVGSAEHGDAAQAAAPCDTTLKEVSSMSSSKNITGALVALALVPLAACSATHNATVAAPAAAGQVITTAGASVAAVRSAAPTAAPSVGARLDDAAAKALPDGWKAYPLPDGTKIAVSSMQPLPAPVLAASEAKLAAPTAAIATDTNNGQLDGEAVNAVADEIKRLESLTGRRVVAVWRDYVNDQFTWRGETYQQSLVGAALNSSTKDQAVAKARAWVAARPDANRWEILVIG